MTNDKINILLEQQITDAIRYAPEADVSKGFKDNVMARLTPKRVSLWRRFWLAMVQPRVMTFRPIQVIPAVTVVAALLVLAVFQLTPQSPSDAPAMTTVRFVMHDAGHKAANVAVIGSFNDWRAERSVMWYSHEDGAWVLEAQLPPGDHEYLFLVNGEKLVSDPQAAMTRDDGFGNKNSILFVNGVNEQSL